MKSCNYDLKFHENRAQNIKKRNQITISEARERAAKRSGLQTKTWKELKKKLLDYTIVEELPEKSTWEYDVKDKGPGRWQLVITNTDSKQVGKAMIQQISPFIFESPLEYLRYIGRTGSNRHLKAAFYLTEYCFQKMKDGEQILNIQHKNPNLPNILTKSYYFIETLEVPSDSNEKDFFPLVFSFWSGFRADFDISPLLALHTNVSDQDQPEVKISAIPGNMNERIKAHSLWNPEQVYPEQRSTKIRKQKDSIDLEIKADEENKEDFIDLDIPKNIYNCISLPEEKITELSHQGQIFLKNLLTTIENQNKRDFFSYREEFSLLSKHNSIGYDVNFVTIQDSYMKNEELSVSIRPHSFIHKNLPLDEKPDLIYSEYKVKNEYKKYIQQLRKDLKQGMKDYQAFIQTNAISWTGEVAAKDIIGECSNISEIISSLRKKANYFEEMKKSGMDISPSDHGESVNLRTENSRTAKKYGLKPVLNNL